MGRWSRLGLAAVVVAICGTVAIDHGGSRAAGRMATASVRSHAAVGSHARTGRNAKQLWWQGPLMVSGRHPRGLFASDQNGAPPTLLTCAPGLCLQVDGSGYLYGSVDPASGHWSRTPTPLNPELGDVSCASRSFCEAIPDTARLQVSGSTRPLRPPWSRPITLGRDPTDSAGITCPADGECLVLSGTGQLYWSAAAMTPGSWHHFRIAGAAGDQDDVQFECPTTSLCFVLAANGRTFVSTDPTAGASAWTRAPRRLAGNVPACASATACALVTGGGQIYGSSTPAVAGSWRLQFREPASPGPLISPGPGALTCTAPARCVAVGENGRLVYTDDLSATDGGWRQGGRLFDLADTDTADTGADCAGPSVCIVQTPNGTVRAITQPSQPSGIGRRVWLQGPAAALVRIDCPSASLCLAVDSHGDLQTSRTPTAGGQWAPLRLDQPLADVACGSAQACVAVGRLGTLFVSRTPADGPQAWARVAVRDRIAAASCPRPGFCAAIATDGRTYTSSDPGVAGAWRRHPVLGGWSRSSSAARSASSSPSSRARARSTVAVRPAISCWSVHGCVIAGDGAVWSSRDPAAAHGSWRRTAVPAAARSLSIACPSAARCIARTSLAFWPHSSALIGTDVVSRSPHWSGRRAISGLVHCFGPRLCAEVLQHFGVHDKVLVSDHGARGRFVRTFNSGIESDAPPNFVPLDDVACVPGRFCLIAADYGGVMLGRFGKGRCVIDDESEIGCGGVEVAELR